MEKTQLAAFNGYLHVSYNMLVENPESSTYIRLTTDKGNSIGPNNQTVNVSALLNEHQWNRIDLVIKLDGNKVQTVDKGVANGLTKVYVNGVYASETNTCFGGFNKDNGFCGAFRVGISSKNSNVKMWMDDYKTYTSYIEPLPAAMPTAIEGNIGDTVASVTAQGAKVYENVLYKDLLSDDAVLSHGNVIVKESGSDYVYHTVADPDIKHYMTVIDDFSSTVRFTRDWSAAGIGGKSENDYSLKLVKHTHETDANYINMYPQFLYDREADAKKYTVIAYNLYVPSDTVFKGIGMHSQNHTDIAAGVSDSMISRDRWNSVVNVIEYSEEGAKYTTYLNGDVIGTADKLIPTKDVDGETQIFGDSGFNQIRLAIVAEEITDIITAYMDDIIVYETDEKFVPAKLTFDDTFTAAYDIVDGEKVYVAEGAAVADVKAALPGTVVVRAEEVLADDALLAKGDIIRCGEVENYVNNLSAYRAAVVGGYVFGNTGIRMYKEDGTTSVAAGDNVKVRIADGGILVVTGYDSSDALTETITDMTSSASYKEITVPDAERVSFIAIDGFDTLKPLYQSIDLSFSAE